MIGQAARDLADALTAAGVPTGTDPRNLNPPCGFLTPSLIDYDRLDVTTATVEWELHLLAPDTEPTIALDQLNELIERVATVAPPGQVTPQALQLTNLAPDGVPSLLVKLTTEITKD